eukprot:TRINITY_DN16029_c0_g1_i1.p2 TRINITY_DN16029_c0_g1~~TRINITY_DN16029_c0_g1_i1.p2  ORF type:complete len:232 (+),score=56.99 TRINITY_DN16029_c0_g1_i1:56-751(+)
MVQILGLTGGIACGKSTVSSMLREKGAVIVDADAISRAVLAPGTPWTAKVLQTFKGDDIADAHGNIDRDKLGEVVFADAAKRRKLTGIMQWPILKGLLREIVGALLRCPGILVLDMPLLFETKVFTYLCEATLVVDVSDELQIERLVARNGYTQEHARERAAAQMPKAKKAALADYVVDNNGTRESTREQVARVVSTLRGRRRLLPPVLQISVVLLVVPACVLWKLWRLWA